MSNIPHLPNELLFPVFLYLDQIERLCTIRQLSKTWNHILTSEDNMDNYELESLKYEECIQNGWYQFIGYKVTYKTVTKLMKYLPMLNDETPMYKYDNPKLNQYMMNKFNTQLVVYLDPIQYEETTEDFYVGVLLKAADKYVKLFVKSLSLYTTRKDVLYDHITKNKLSIKRKLFRIYRTKYNINKHTDTNPIFNYLYHVLYKQDITLDKFLTKYDITINALIDIIYPNCNIKTLKTLYDCKYLSKRKYFFKTSYSKLEHAVIKLE